MLLAQPSSNLCRSLRRVALSAYSSRDLEDLEDLEPVTLDGGPLSIETIAALARHRAPVVVSPETLERVRGTAAYADDIASQRAIYGRTTGVGANRQVAVDDPEAAARRLLRSHATSGGRLREADRVRAMLLVRANQIAVGGNGIRAEVLAGLVRLLAEDVLPPVREWGGVGTGDLAALATTGLVLDGTVELQTAPSRLERLTPGDSLALISSNAATIGDAALAVHDLGRLADLATEVAAATFVAVQGNPEAYGEAVELGTPFVGSVEICRRMRGMLLGAQTGSRIQDPYGLRALPQVHGALLDTLARAEFVVTAMASAPSENPALNPLLGVAHHGSFHAAHLAQALDAVRSAVAQSAELGRARIVMLGEPAFTGQRPFLAEDAAGASGTMLLEYVAAGALAELRASAAPVATQTITLSRGIEEDASFASLGAHEALRLVERYATVIAVEALCAYRCARLAGRSLPGVEGLLSALDACLPSPLLADGLADRDLTGDLRAVTRVIRSRAGAGSGMPD